MGRRNRGGFGPLLRVRIFPFHIALIRDEVAVDTVC